MLRTFSADNKKLSAKTVVSKHDFEIENQKGVDTTVGYKSDSITPSVSWGKNRIVVVGSLFLTNGCTTLLKVVC
jgi:hypothetical protein